MNTLDGFALAWKTAGGVFALVFGSGVLWRWREHIKREGRREQQFDTLIESVNDLAQSFKDYAVKTDERFTRYDEWRGAYAERMIRMEQKMESIYPLRSRTLRLENE